MYKEHKAIITNGKLHAYKGDESTSFNTSCGPSVWLCGTAPYRFYSKNTGSLFL
jgi:hypothetical protein